MSENLGFDSTVNNKPDTGCRDDCGNADDCWTLSPGTRKADIDDVADQEETRDNAIPDYGPNVAIVSNEVAPESEEARHVPDAQQAKRDSGDSTNRAWFRQRARLIKFEIR
jgi:hypothetical protein